MKHFWNTPLKSMLRNIPTTLFQFFVAISLWQLLMLQIRPSNVAEDGPGNGNRWMLDLPICVETVDPAGKRLRLDSVISSGHVFSSVHHDLREHYFLRVGIIKRDVERGCLDFYPAGTLVSFDQNEGVSRSSVRDLQYLEYNGDDFMEVPVNAADETRNNLKKKAAEVMRPDENKLLNRRPKFKQATFKGDTDSLKLEKQLLAVMFERDQVFQVEPQKSDQSQQTVAVNDTHSESRNEEGDQAVGDLSKGDKLSSNREKSFVQLEKDSDLNKQINLSITDLDVEGDMESDPASLQNQMADDNDLDLVDVASEPLFSEGFLERVRSVKTLFDAGSRRGLRDEKSFRHYRLNCPDLCKESQRADILFLVNSSPGAWENRKRIREAILNSPKNKPFTVVGVFLTGKTAIPNTQKMLEYEQREHGDLVQGDFMDSTENDTLKDLMGIRWAMQHCRRTPFVFRMNDDVFVDTYKLLHGLLPTAETIVGKCAMFCVFHSEGSMSLANLHRDHFKSLFSKNISLPHCKAFGVLMTRRVIPSLLAASHHVPGLFRENFYLFGILPYLAGGVEAYDLGRQRGIDDLGMDAKDCYKEKGDKCPIFASRSTPSDFSLLWEHVNNRNKTTQDLNTRYQKFFLWDLKSYQTYF